MNTDSTDSINPAGTAVYEVRHGWTRADAKLVAGSSLYLVAVAAPGMPLLMRVGGVLLLYIVLAGTILPSLSRAVALRADDKGITLGGSFPFYRSTTATVPWHEITAVAVWSRTGSGVTWRNIGLERTPGLPLLPGSGRNPLSRWLHILAGPRRVSPELRLSSRIAATWHLDIERLTAAVSHFSPHTAVRDLD
ncbi:hypothetical protein GCM10027168_74840 [Streptomyces capparidis]